MSNDDDTWGQFGTAGAGGSGFQWEDAEAGHPFETPERGRYVREREIGRGGMGRVLSVVDQRLGRSVALKETRTDSDEAATRLAREAVITARLQHPGIVPVYDAGQGETGRLFYTMRLIEGRSLRAALSEREGLEERLPLLRPYLAICHAVAYAHEQGVIHRDLKPDNVMLGARGEAMVVDWGLARMSDAQAPLGPLPTGIHHETRDGAVMGTPGYMSPEQATGAEVDARADVWSLGCILYAILTGADPFDGEPASIMRRVLAGEVPPLDEAVVPGALIAIVERAMAPQLADRYPSAGALADEIARYLDGRLVEAHSYTPLEQLKIVLSQWRAPLAVALVAVVVLAVGAAGAWGRITAERARALDAEGEAIAAREQSDVHLQQALLAQASLAHLSGARAKAETLAAHALVLGELPRARGVLAASSLQPRPELAYESAPMGCDWFDLSLDGKLLCADDKGISLWSGTPLAEQWRQPFDVRTAYFFDDDRYILADIEGDVDVIFDVRDGTTVERTRIYTSPSVRLVVGSESARVVSFAGPEYQHFWPARSRTEGDCEAGIISMALHGGTTAQICNASGTLRASGLGPAPIRSRILGDIEGYSAALAVRFSPSGRYLVLGSLEGWLELLSVSPTLETKSLALRSVGENAILSVAFSEDEKTIAFTRDDGRVGVWTPEIDLLSTLPSADAALVAFDGDDLLVMGDVLRRWRLPPSRRPASFQNTGGVSAAALSPDGTAVAAALSGFAAAAWTLTDGRRRFRQTFETSNVMKDITFSVDGNELIAVGAGDLEPQRLDPQTGAVHGTLPEPTRGYRRVLAMQDGLVATIGWRGLFVWQDGAPLRSLILPSLDLYDAETTPDGSLAVMTTVEGDAYLLAARPRPRVERLAQLPELSSVDLSPDGTLLAWADHEAIVLALRSELSVQRRIPRNTRTFDISLSPDSRWIAAAGYSDVTLYDVETGDIVAVLDGHSERVASVDFSDDGSMLVTGGWDGLVRLWGTDAIVRDPAEMLEEIEAAWKLSLSEALAD